MKRVYYVFVLIIVLLNYSCDKVFEEDLSKESIEVVMPKDSIISDNLSIQFWWKFEFNASYDIEIVSPSFENPVFYCVDTIISGTKFIWNFKPGWYQWRIRAFNNSTSTSYQYYNFLIDSSYNLSNTQMILLHPSSDGYYNNRILNFNWLTVFSASNYYVSLSDFNQNLLFFDKEINSNSFILPSVIYTDTLKEGKYRWGVRAANQSSSSNYSYSYFTIDRTPPSSPVLWFPANNNSVPDSNIHFKWVSGIDAIGNLPYDSIWISKDSTFLQMLTNKKVSTNEFVDSLGMGHYWWQVRSYDKAGNMSKSSIHKLQVN